MSEREANERRKIKRGSISGLANTTMKVAASQDGQGPAEKQPDPIPAGHGPSTGRRFTGRPGTNRRLNTVPQQADASQEGQGPRNRRRNTVPQQADASQEGQGEPETKAAVPQQADASQEGQGGNRRRKHGPPTGRRLQEEPETKAAVPQQADASQEGQRPAELEEDTDTVSVRK